MGSGHWVKPGRKGADPQAPGSYGDYEYRRGSPKAYKKTEMQKKIAGAGREVGEKCKGKTGSDFKLCRSDIMRAKFG